MATQEEAPAAETRIPCPHEHSGWPTGHQASSCQGSYASRRLICTPKREARDGGVGKLLTLRRECDVERVFSQGERFRGRELLVIRLFRDEGGLRVAFLTARGIGTTVRRNRVRRRLREACRSIWPEIADRPADVLFMGLPPAAVSEYASLRGAILKLLRKAGVLDATDAAE